LTRGILPLALWAIGLRPMFAPASMPSQSRLLP